MQVDLITISGIALGLTSVLSQTGLPSRFKPIVSIIIGIGVAYLLSNNFHQVQSIVDGLIGGLTASGLWSGVKSASTPSVTTDSSEKLLG